MSAITKAAVPPEWYVVSTLLGVWVGFFGAPWLASRRQGTGHFLADLGVRFRWVDLWGIAIGLGSQIVISLLYAPFRHDIHDFNGPTNKLTGGAHGGGYLLIALATVVVAPFMEELFFRGLLFKGLARLLTPVPVGATSGPGRGRRRGGRRRRPPLRPGPRRMGSAGRAGAVRNGAGHRLLPDGTSRHEHGVARHVQSRRRPGDPPAAGRCDPLTSTLEGPEHGRGDRPHRRATVEPRLSRPWPPSALWAPKVATALCVASVIVVVLWQLHPSLLMSTSASTGGDNGGHYAMPAFLRSGLLSHGQLTGWDPGWYDGFPLYTFYFVLPDLFAALASYVIPYALAFKWITVLGSVLLPVAAWAMGRLFGMRRAVPGALAALTLCYLFDYTYTIYGGNLFSTLAGEYSYSFSIALALVFLGLMARGLRTGQYRGWAAVTLGACILAHFVPALFALLGAGFLIVMEMLPDRHQAAGQLARPPHRPGRPAGPEPA